MKVKPTDKSPTMGEYNLTDVISNQSEEIHSPQRNNVATTINFFLKKVSPERRIWKPCGSSIEHQMKMGTLL